MEPTKNHYNVRFNTKHGETSLYWRVFENNVEYLVEHVQITARLYDEQSVEHGVTKFNIACDGYMKIVDGTAYISESLTS